MSAAQDDDTRDGVWAPRFAPVAQIIPPNVFADMDVKVAAAVASGADVIDLAKGNPDAYPAEFIRDVAKSSVDDPLNARYTPFDGKPAFPAVRRGRRGRRARRTVRDPDRPR